MTDERIAKLEKLFERGMISVDCDGEDLTVEFCKLLGDMKKLIEVMEWYATEVEGRRARQVLNEIKNDL